MPVPDEHLPLPLDLLISRLEAAGFRVDTSRRLRMLRLFDDLGNPFVGGHFEELKYLLSPLVSRSPQEQERFYEIFDAFWLECEAEAVQAEAGGAFAEGEKTVGGGEVLAKAKKRRWWWLVFFGLAPAAVFFLSLIEVEPAFLTYPPYTAEGDTLWVSGETMKMRKYLMLGMTLPVVHPKSTVHWEVRDSTMRTTLHRDTGDLVWPVSEKYGRDISILSKTIATTWFREVVEHDTFLIGIDCSNPPEVSDITTSAQPPYQPDTEYEFSLRTEPGCLVVWNNTPDTLTVDATGRSTFRLKTTGAAGAGIFINATVYRPENIGYCYTSKTLPIAVGNDKPILQLAEFQRDEGFKIFTISRLGWLLILLPLLLAGWFFRRWWKKRNTPAPQKTPEELAAQYPVTDAGPYFIPYLPQEHNITVPREFFRIAELLRRREEGHRRYFDGPATVRATIDSGGFPAWRERAVTRPAEYLFLVERPDEREQQGRLFARLCDFMKRRDVPMAAFFHNGSFDHFWNADTSNGLPLAELRRRYPHHRLVLLGAAHGLVNPYASRQPELLRESLDGLLHWPRRLLLTPEPVAAWSFQEALLHRHFLLFPADTEGILSGIDLLDRTEEYHPGRFERWQEGRAPRHSQETHRYRTWKTAAEHADYLRDDPECYRWLCALAICPQPDWSLTLAIGRAVGAEVTHDRLLRLTRIPWLSQNQPNDGLRLDLLRQLSPADEQVARTAVVRELEAVRYLTANSFADTERTANAAVQNFALDPRDETHKQAIRDLRALGLVSGSQEAELDFIVQEKADKSGLPDAAGADISSWLDVPAPKRFWTRDMVLGMLSVFLSVFLTVGLLVQVWQQKNFSAPFDFLLENVAQDDELIQLNERAIGIAERVLGVEDHEKWLSLQDSVRMADSLFQEVAGIASTAEQGNQLKVNLPIYQYNVNVKNFNFYQTESLPVGTLWTTLRGFESVKKAVRASNAGKYKPENFSIKFELDVQHGQGLCYYYLGKDSIEKVAHAFAQQRKDVSALSNQVALIDSARHIYEEMLPFFEHIREQMPVNLETLLQADKMLDTDKNDTANTDEEIKKNLAGHWFYERAGSVKVINIFRKDGSAIMLVYNPENKPEQTGTGKWSVENKSLVLVQDGDVTKSEITYLDNKQLVLDDGTTLVLSFRRIQPDDRDGDGVLDVVDNCPAEKGKIEKGGCPENQNKNLAQAVFFIEDSISLIPVEGALITIKQSGFSTKTTGGDGTATFMNLPLGKIDLIVVKDGYYNKNIGLNISSDDKFNIFRVPIKGDRDGELFLTGEVTDKSGRSIQGAWIEVKLADLIKTVITDESGNFTVEIPSSSRYNATSIQISIREKDCKKTETIDIPRQKVLYKDFILDCISNDPALIANATPTKYSIADQTLKGVRVIIDPPEQNGNIVNIPFALENIDAKEPFIEVSMPENSSELISQDGNVFQSSSILLANSKINANFNVRLIPGAPVKGILKFNVGKSRVEIISLLKMSLQGYGVVEFRSIRVE